MVKEIMYGVDGIKLTMLNYPKNVEEVYELIYNMTMVTFRPGSKGYLPKTPENIEKVVKEVLEGKTLRNALEALKFTFKIENVSRTMTHQHVRARIGAGYTQESERANYVGDKAFRMPYVVAQNPKLKEKWEKLQKEAREVYDETVESGVHTQDARFILPQGLTSNIYTTMTFNAIENFCKYRRGCINMQWEIHYAARLLEKWFKEWDKLLGSAMTPLCEKIEKCTWGNIDFPPCGKFNVSEDYEEPEKGYLFPLEANGSQEFEENLQ